jgi:osmoprotectant transport system substrate-binding protein
MNGTLHCALVASLLWTASCGESKPPLIVGSKPGVQEQLLGEIVAQHLERRLETPVVRRLGSGDTPVLHQELLTGQMTLYPDYTGALISEVLKETPSTVPDVAFQRARGEMLRRYRLEISDPLGFDNRTVMVVRAAGAPGLATLSQAAQVKPGWKLGVSYEFQSRAEGLPALNQYHLPMAASFRSMNQADLFPSLEQGAVTMIAAQAADGYLTTEGWTILEDDLGVFAPQDAVIVTRQDAFALEPRLKPALAELAGKLTLETVRAMNAQVVLDERQAADVARKFLESAGL